MRLDEVFAIRFASLYPAYLKEAESNKRSKGADNSALDPSRK